MSQSDRLFSILLELQERRWQRAADMAEHLAVSTRTIYRDMSLLEEAGVPVEAVPGRGYRLHADYFLPPLVLTTDEAILLKLGSQHLAHHFDKAYRSVAYAAGLKLDAILPDELQATVERLQESLHLAPTNAFDQPTSQTLRRTLQQALHASRAVRFEVDARSNGSPTHIVHPYSLVHLRGRWHLVGLNVATERVSHFAFETIRDLEILDDTFTRPASYRTTPDTSPAPRLSVRVRFALDVAEWVLERPHFHLEATDQRADGLYVTLQVDREAELMPWLLSWGTYAYVLEPASLRQRLAREAEGIAAQYRRDVLALF